MPKRLPVLNKSTTKNSTTVSTSLAAGQEKTLSKSIQSCTACAISKYCDHKVLWSSNGNTRSKHIWLFVGEAPGRTEYIQKQPFVGNSGSVLARMLAETNVFDYVKTTFTNAILCTPFDTPTRMNIRTPNKKEITACSKHLSKQLELFKPTNIFAVGKVASGILDHLKIDHHILTHPSSILRQGHHGEVDYKRNILILRREIDLICPQKRKPKRLPKKTT